MYVVGCDFGLVKSGIVILNEQGNLVSQALIRVKSRSAQRLVDIEAGFDQLIAPYEEVLVVVEGYAYGAKYQRESLAELGGVMRRYFCVNELDYWVVPPTMLKSYITGNGKASKNYMKKCTKERWDLTFRSDDVCDAHGLARLGQQMLVLKRFEDVPDVWSALAQHEYEVLDELIHNSSNYLNANTAKRKRRNK